jgi:hypothetical protein
MKFGSNFGVDFEIADDWWIFAEMSSFSCGMRTGYPYHPSAEVAEVTIAEIKPPMRNPEVELFEKCRMVSILLAFKCCSPLPPVDTELLAVATGPYRFRVYDGFHRYYASIAAGFTVLPVRLVKRFR